jgi:hypothetical protein
MCSEESEGSNKRRKMSKDNVNQFKEETTSIVLGPSASEKEKGEYQSEANIPFP